MGRLGWMIKEEGEVSHPGVECVGEERTVEVGGWELGRDVLWKTETKQDGVRRCGNSIASHGGNSHLYTDVQYLQGAASPP